MGLIEDSIFAIYKKSLEDGDIKQAEKAVELAGILKEKVENEGFIDQNLNSVTVKSLPGSFFEPYPYRYYPEKGVVVLGKSAINLTTKENQLFLLLSLNESSGNNLRIITKEHIYKHMWGEKTVTSNSLRISILRLRKKIEVDKVKPSLIVSIYNKGYVFFGKRVKSIE